MNRKRLFSLALAFLMGSFTLVNAQDTATETVPATQEPTAVTLNDQFEQLKRKSNSWEDYKVIKKFKLNDFWKVVQDSLQASKTDILQKQIKIGEQQSDIDKLEVTLKEKEEALAENDYLITHINVLGLDFQKDTYVYMNFGIIITLLILIGLGYIRYNKSNKTAADKKNELEALEKEFFDFKQTAREREAKIKREMQTEMNRAEELERKLAVAR